MAKFSAERFPAGFFDVTSDIAGPLPIELIERWTRGAQTDEAARRILEPYAVRGIVVSSDGSGLTRLTGSRALLDILSLLDHPKQLIHAYGTAIGGEAVGIWTADNTQMFYRDAGAGDVVAMLLSLQDEVRRQCELQIGVAAHAGRFFQLAGALYGAESDRVEALAEGHAGPGEIVITSELSARIAEPGLFETAPHDASAALGANLRVTGGPRRAGLDARDSSYPIPYSEDFYEDLLRMATGSAEAADFEQVQKNYGRQRAVALIEREREESAIDEVAALNELAMSLAMRKIGWSLLAGTGGHEVKTSGSIGIYTFEDCEAALDFVRRFRDALLARGVLSRGAIDYGDVLVFRVRDGLEDIAGMPVNLASKIAQDNGEFGRIYLSAAAARRARIGGGFQPVSFAIAGVDVDAFME
jgi:hypothetical protein